MTKKAQMEADWAVEAVVGARQAVKNAYAEEAAAAETFGGDSPEAIVAGRAVTAALIAERLAEATLDKLGGGATTIGGAL